MRLEDASELLVDERVAAPTTLDAAVKMRFWGVRGSIPVSHPDKSRYGGNTACIEVQVGERMFVVDAGSGIVELGRSLKERGVRKIDLLLTHLHHDHVQGLFFFKPLFDPGVELTIHCGNLGGETAEAALRRMFSPPLFPLTFDMIGAKVTFRGFKAGETLDFGDGLLVRTQLLKHPSGSTAYRFDHRGAAVAIVTDIEHEDDGPCGVLSGFVKGCDTIVYDTMMCPTEYPACKGWGHSTRLDGVELCKCAGVKRLVGFHHHPAYDDDVLGEMDARLHAELPGSYFAREGQVVSLFGR